MWRNEEVGSRKSEGKKRGQSTLEYVLVLAAVVAAIALAAGTVVKPAVDQGMKDSSNVMKAATGKLEPGLGLTTTGNTGN